MSIATTEKTVQKVKNRLTNNIGGMVDQMHELREQKRELEEQVKVIEAKYSALEEDLMAKLEAEGTSKCAGKKASASITMSVVGNVLDWEALHAYIKKTGYFHLMQKRISEPAYRELLESGKKVPGVEPFTKKKLNVRTLG